MELLLTIGKVFIIFFFLWWLVFIALPPLGIFFMGWIPERSKEYRRLGRAWSFWGQRYQWRPYASNRMGHFFLMVTPGLYRSGTIYTVLPHGHYYDLSVSELIRPTERWRVIDYMVCWFSQSFLLLVFILAALFYSVMKVIGWVFPQRFMIGTMIFVYWIFLPIIMLIRFFYNFFYKIFRKRMLIRSFPGNHVIADFQDTTFGEQILKKGQRISYSDIVHCLLC